VVLVAVPEAVLRFVKGGDVVTDLASREGIRFNRRLVIGGGVLIGIGGLLGFTGVLLLSSAVVSATRRWVDQLEQPPSELAKLKWRQARAATTAGARAWRSGPPTQSSSS
jgi:hypothetical protein